MKTFWTILFGMAGLFFISLGATAADVPMFLVAQMGGGTSIGTLTLKDSSDGLQIDPVLSGLPAGEHGIHVHANDSCDNFALAAGGHFDPKDTGKHLGPYSDDGHLGDLPVLVVADDGTASASLVAPRLMLKDIAERAIVIHANGDNYSDQPKALGGGGDRIACGVVPMSAATEKPPVATAPAPQPAASIDDLQDTADLQDISDAVVASAQLSSTQGQADTTSLQASSLSYKAGDDGVDWPVLVLGTLMRVL